MKQGFFNLLSVIYLLVIAGLVVGEISCVIKAVECDWEPIGKAEIVYTGAALTGLGCIVGYMEIEDSNNVILY